ncbi:MAG: uroporphyrinogen decarboxylase family protein [Chloroflexota bacterium]|nr:uroporphyrinogen decarboxylase family protein [Chloroflexota bacterium]
MNSRERIQAIIAGEPADHCGFWLGNPDPATWPILYDHFGVSNKTELRQLLDDDFLWVCPELSNTYRHPAGRQMFDLEVERLSHGQPGPFANCEDVSELDDYEWPNLDYLHYDDCLDELRNAGDVYRASGHWTPFYHDLCFLFGMENYFVKMYTHPDVVHAVTDRVCQFYYQANERFFKQAGDLVDGYFFGNDFGTQRDLMISPDKFDEFVMPWFRQFTEQGHRHDCQVILHSCGSIYRVIERLIETGVDCLHPLQARANNMDAETLAREFKGRIAFLGGIDAQDILPYGTPDEVRAEVHRVRGLLEPALIVSPSHEAILPDVPPENVKALALAARE